MKIKKWQWLAQFNDEYGELQPMCIVTEHHYAHAIDVDELDGSMWSIVRSIEETMIEVEE